jgi:hypothetical protein
MATGLRRSVLALVITLTFGCALAQAADESLALQLEVLEARIGLATLYEPIERARQEIDRGTIDPQALGFSLAFEEA